MLILQKIETFVLIREMKKRLLEADLVLREIKQKRIENRQDIKLIRNENKMIAYKRELNKFLLLYEAKGLNFILERKDQIKTFLTNQKLPIQLETFELR